MKGFATRPKAIRCRVGRPQEWAEPAIPWNDLVTRWNESRDRLEAKIRHFPVEDLAKQVPGRDYPYETLLHGIVQHAIYHPGQIAMVLSMLRARSVPHHQHFPN